MVNNSPLIKPYFLGRWHWGGVPLGSHDFFLAETLRKLSLPGSKCFEVPRKLPVIFSELANWRRSPVAQIFFAAANCQSQGSSHSSDAHVSSSWTYELSPPEPGAPQVTTEPSAKMAAKASRVA